MKKTNQLNMELIGVSSLDNFPSRTSASRQAMRSSHIGQAVTLAHGEQRRIYTGAEYRYGEYTFNVKFPVDARVIKVIPKYPQTATSGKIKNPRTLVVYEPVSGMDKKVGILEIPTYMSKHKDFGYRLHQDQEISSRLRKDQFFKATDIIAGSPSVMNVDGYGYGVNANIVSISAPSTNEDGIEIRRGFLEKLMCYMYHKTKVNFGRRYVPLNLYGTEDEYKCFPDIGQCVRDDGLMYALREIDESTSAAEMTPKALMTIDYENDRLVYGKKSARVVDITVYHDERMEDGGCPAAIAEQPRRYYEANKRYNEELLRTYDQLRRDRKRGRDPEIDDTFNRLMVEAQIFLSNKVSRLCGLEKLDEWRVEIECEYVDIPSMGYKLTDLYGGKGVICKITDDDKMYRDENGNLVDIAIANASTVKRSIPSRYFEQFFNAVRRDNVARIREMLGLDRFLKGNTEEDIEQAVFEHPDRMKALDILTRVYENSSEKNYEFITTLKNDQERLEHLYWVVKEDAYLNIRPDMELDLLEGARNIQKSDLAPHYGYLTFTNDLGQKRTTKNRMLTGEMYIVLLEKLPTGWASVASPRYQHLGIPAKISNVDKHAAYGREQVIKTVSESEARAFSAYAGDEFVAELMDRTNNPATHRMIVWETLDTEDHGTVFNLVDRKKIPLGNSRPVQFTRNFMACNGVTFKYHRDEEEQ